MAMRVAGVKEGEGRKAMSMTTRVSGKPAATATTKAMVMKTKEVGEAEGNSTGSKSDGNGKEDGSDKQ